MDNLEPFIRGYGVAALLAVALAGCSERLEEPF
jgi:hypothetical protein